MPTALLLTDLEGVAGVDTLEALVAGGPGHARACALLRAETLAAIEGLRAGGFERIRVSDTHRSGASAPHLNPRELPPGVELVWKEDAYDAFDGVSAVAMLGMHAPAGTRGFAAHTVAPYCDWRVGRRRLSEADLVLGLAHAHGVGVVFVSGDDVLKKHLGNRVRFVETKRSSAVDQTRSHAIDAVLAEIRAVAGQPPWPATPAGEGPIEVSFQSAWQARAAGVADSRMIQVDAADFPERYRAALAAVYASGEAIGRAIRGAPGQAAFTEDASALLRRRYRAAAPAALERRATRALRSWLELTEGPEAWRRADRALTLHMLEGHAPGFFARARLRPTLRRAVEALRWVSPSLEPGLGADEAMARMDALYLRHVRLAEPPPLDAGSLRATLEDAVTRHGPAHAWLLGELAARIGVDARLSFPPRPFRLSHRVADLYWLTHLFLLATDYFAQPLGAGWDSEVEELTLAAPRLIEDRYVDLAGEAAFCLQAAGEHATAEHGSLLGLVARHQRADGSVRDPSSDDDDRDTAHATAVALLAFAGATSSSGRSRPARPSRARGR